MKKQKNLSAPEIKEIEKNLLELQKVFITLRSIMIMRILNTKE